jgi:hypothetical protein
MRTKEFYKLILLFTIYLFSIKRTNAQSPCSQLFISEYVEGSMNNKAIELYNPKSYAVDLSQYRLVRYANGATDSPSDEILTFLPNTYVPPLGTYVISLNLTDPNGTGQSTPIAEQLQAVADTLVSNCAIGSIRTMCFNGDDAIVLQRLVNGNGNWVNVDIFGCIGEQPLNSQGTTSPTAGWTNLPPFSIIPSGYDGTIPYFNRYWTIDQTLIRKPTIKSGVTINPEPESFNPSIEWDSLPQNTFDSLGSHTCECIEQATSGEINNESVQQCNLNAVELSFIELPGTGLGNVSYQWYVANGLVSCPQGGSTIGWQPIPGAAASTASFTPPGIGIYTLACLVIPEASTGFAPEWAIGCKVLETSSLTSQAIVGNPNIIPFVPFTYLVTEIPGHYYTWNVNGGTISNGQNNYQVTVIWGALGPYSIELIETDGICTVSNSFTVINSNCDLLVFANPAGATSFCYGDSAMIVATSAGASTYQWQINGVTIIGATNDTLFVTESGNYQVIATQSANCSAISLPVSITEFAPFIPPSISVESLTGDCNNQPVTLTANGNFTFYVWNTGASGESIEVNTSGSYYVIGSFSQQGLPLCEAVSLPVELNLALLPPVNICVVSVDSITGRNIVVWEKPQTTAIDSFVIFRETAAAELYQIIGTQSFEDFSTFIDPQANPLAQASRYRLGLIDTCGVLSSTSTHHKTIHLTLNLGVGGTVNLIWSGYEGVNFPSYVIYRGTSPDQLTELVTIQSNLNSYTDLNPPSGTVYYQIGIQVAGCNPTAFGYEQSRSNLSNTSATGLNRLSQGFVKVYPNPAHDFLIIQCEKQVANGQLYIKLFNTLGQLTYSSKLISEFEKINVKSIGLKGIYLVQITDEKNDLIFQQKIFID